MPEPVDPEDWSYDHWRTLAYAFTCLGDGGRLNPLRLRLDGTKHPTRIKDRFVTGHNDVDCLSDMERAGVLKNVGTGSNPVVQFTPEGLKLGQWLCRMMDAHSVKTRDLTWEAALSASMAHPNGVWVP